ncbi:imm11 family protein [Pyxidicoccus sp. MSG2]|uniref:imm11 family protein n=1 Tax=Pyxidicoccus sp. MSG2 TaxID=2996790 RepID=UPI00226E65F0|nr:DUF1629 domain-containing protein [Pyxidicoccus sp. MSG2]MCY1019308.1 hypothetical protein [Pyxidicoccus sp. MSG2]
MYYILECFSSSNGHKARIEYRDDDPFRFWNAGERLESVPDLPIRARVVTDKQSMLAELWDTPLPLMTRRLHDVLVAAGVTNLDVYPVILTDSRSGEEITDYLAFNIIGAIAAADLQATRFAPGSTERTISADIDSLAIDPAKTRGALMFRLAEAVNAIIVHEQVKAAVEASGIGTLTFMSPEDWVG